MLSADQTKSNYKLYSHMETLFTNGKLYIGVYIWQIMESQKIMEGLFDRKILTILKLFLKKKDQQFYLKEISKQTRVPLASTHRILNKLLELEIIEKVN